ncbi:MAG: SBBP repeat-containing protein [Promethearchaeota archaeon]
MTKISLLALVGSVMIFSALIFPVWFFYPLFTDDSSHIGVMETRSSSSIDISSLREEGVIIDPLKVDSHAKDIELPFSGFIQNLGQLSDASIQYYYSMNGLSVGFSPSIITFVCKSQAETDFVKFSLTFPDSQAVAPVGQIKKTHYINYFYGDFQLTDVPTWDEVWYYDLYPGIDLRYYMSTQGFKYDFVVHPGADPSQITMKIGDSMTLSINEHMVSIQSRDQPAVCFQDTALRVFQADGTAIAARFSPTAARSNTYGFQVDPFDPTQVLIIDPLWLTFSTFLGGSSSDAAYGITVDADNNSYVIGRTLSSNFPTQNAYNDTYGGGSLGYDAFVAKLNATGNGLVFSTYLGGSGDDEAHGIALDADRNTYITGWTDSSNFPTQNAYDSTYDGFNDDVFVTKLNAAGNGLVFSTYLGGEWDDWGYAIAVDAAGNSYITGRTDSFTFPTHNALNNTKNGLYDVFVTKLNSTGTGLNFSTYLGGSNDERGFDIVVDTDNNTYITGVTESTNFPTKNAYNDTYSGNDDVFVMKLNSTGTGLNFSTYLGGESDDWGYAIAVDTAGNSYITGRTSSSNFPMVNAYNDTYSGTQDVFVTKLNATGTGLKFSTYLGGNGIDYGFGIAVDADGNSYITGDTKSSNFPMKNAYDSTYNGIQDVFVTKLNAMGTGLNFSTYLGGSAHDYAYGIAVDIEGNSYISGHTLSSDFPTRNAYNSTLGKGYDVYVTKFGVDITLPSIFLNSPANNSIHPSGTTIDLTITDLNGISHVLYNWDSTANITLLSPYDVTLPVGNGQHVLHVYAYDTAGNWASATYLFTTEDPTTTTTPTTTSDFFTVDVLLISLVALSLGVVLWRRRRNKVV